MRTLSDKKLNQFVNDFLESGEIINENWMPNKVIGIKNAGDIIGRKLFKSFKQKDLNKEIKYESIDFRRSTTSFKENFLRNGLSKLPTFMLTPLRLIENKFYLVKDKIFNSSMELPEKKGAGIKILLVDDAVDTGNTLIRSIFFLNEKYENPDIKIFCITVTSNSPKIKPDYNLFNENIIFPWSIDFKKKK
ncbi:phosphoribosyltransferase domain-containing protein [Aliifodinibius sp. S!AR15-10]|uniref:phosphoribosyltransferase family protein n=1 Tax=Aliifodinibius sp. S!AR15-10 TaxID=2950437 RepID=UPI00285F23A2|nr:phosphoribosyltransferase family protein [Aliifodinibius sp. S!AR15-10]MDR8393488.1 phosphoribosyltransferase domain-containing protein [Aliifodinibius sp. S!AR15-10]